MKRSTTGKRLTQKIEPTLSTYNRRQRLALDSASRKKTRQIRTRVKARLAAKKAAESKR